MNSTAFCQQEKPVSLKRASGPKKPLKIEYTLALFYLLRTTFQHTGQRVYRNSMSDKKYSMLSVCCIFVKSLMLLLFFCFLLFLTNLVVVTALQWEVNQWSTDPSFSLMWAWFAVGPFPNSSVPHATHNTWDT